MGPGRPNKVGGSPIRPSAHPSHPKLACSSPSGCSTRPWSRRTATRTGTAVGRPQRLRAPNWSRAAQRSRSRLGSAAGRRGPRSRSGPPGSTPHLRGGPRMLSMPSGSRHRRRRLRVLSAVSLSHRLNGRRSGADDSIAGCSRSRQACSRSWGAAWARSDSTWAAGSTRHGAAHSASSAGQTARRRFARGARPQSPTASGSTEPMRHASCPHSPNSLTFPTILNSPYRQSQSSCRAGSGSKASSHSSVALQCMWRPSRSRKRISRRDKRPPCGRLVSALLVAP